MVAIAVPGASETVVIVGAGIAGIRTALGLRDAGFQGTVRLLSDEEHPPYDRPPLSKAVLIDPEGENHIGLDPDRQLAARDIELIISAQCVAVDRIAGTIRLATGAALSYDRLVLATGSSVRSLDILPYGTPGVHYLRYLHDALALRAAVAEPRRIAVAGAGVIGLEVAASLVTKGCTVVIVDPADRVMVRSASPILADILRRRHLAEGVDLRLGTSIASAAGGEGGFMLSLTDGSDIAVEHIVVGVGVTPNIALAEACGLDVRPTGVLVDALGQTSDPMIYAAGEVAFHMNAALGRHDRQETWAHAAAHGEHVARAIMGCDDHYRERASYWTDQYDINIQVVGDPIGDLDVLRGDPEQGGALIFHLRGGAIAGVTAINAVRELRTARKMVGVAIAAPSMLADATVDLKTLM